jgi:hypothetical protein
MQYLICVIDDQNDPGPHEASFAIVTRCRFF